MEKPVERMVRGTIHVGVNSYIERKSDPAAKAKALAALSPELKEICRTASRSSWYPLGQGVELYRAVAAMHDDPAARWDELLSLGKSIAHDATNTFLRLLIRFLTPAVFARKFGEFWRKDHNFGNMESDTSGFSENSLVLNMREVDGYEHIAPVAAGWMTAAFEAIGKKGVTVTETSHPITQTIADSYRFVIKWR